MVAINYLLTVLKKVFAVKPVSADVTKDAVDSAVIDNSLSGSANFNDSPIKKDYSVNNK